MHSRQHAVFDTGTAVDLFFTRHVDVLPKTSQSPVRQQLVVQLGLLRETGGIQGTERMAGIGATALTATMRHVLYHKHLAPVITMAKALMPKTEAFTGLVLPNEHLGTGRLLTEVDGIVGALTPHAALFISNGLDLDFLDQMTAAADAVRMAVAAGANRRGGRIAATSSVGLTAVQITRLIRTLNRLVRAELGDNPGVLADWRNAKRIPRASRSRSSEPSPAPSIAGPVTAPAPPHAGLP